MKFTRATKPVLGVGTYLDGHSGDIRGVTAVVESDGDGVRVLRYGPGSPTADDPGMRGVAFGSLVGVLHRLELPPADSATTLKLIDVQLETRIPGQAEHVRWGWRRESADGPVLVVTAARRRLDALMGRTSLDPMPTLIGTSALALHQLLTACCSAEDRQDLTLIARHDRNCHLLMYRSGRLGLLETIELDPSEDSASPDAVATTIRQHLEASTSAGGGKSLSRGIFTLIGESMPSAELVSVFEKALGRPHRRADGLLGLSGLDRLTTTSLIAVGTAIAAARPHDAINLAPYSADLLGESAYRPTPSRWIAAAVLLVAALVLLYVSDHRKAARVERAVETSGVEATGLASLNIDLEVARFLEKSGPGFLAILDEFGHRTEGFMVDEIRFERDGTFTVRATARSAEEINQLAAKLADMKTLTSVRVRNQLVKDRDKVEYTLIAQPSMRFFAPFAPPPPEAAPEPSPGGVTAEASNYVEGGA
ncbi:MAG: hypothetical protein AAF333_01115 [Planctomycetota bacterium]